MLGDSVSVYLDGGPAGASYQAIGERPGDTSSTIVDATGLDAEGDGVLRIVRSGVISRERIAEVVGEDLLAPADSASAPSGAEGPEPSDADGAPADATADGTPAEATADGTSDRTDATAS